MSDIFAEVSVRVTPDVTGFAKALQSELKVELKKLKKPIIPVGVGLERGALTKLRTEVNNTIAKVKPKPIKVKLVVDPASKAALAAGVPKGITAKAGAGAALPAAAALGSAEGIAATAALTAALDGLSKKLDEVAIKQVRKTKATQEGAAAAVEDAAATRVETKEEKEASRITRRLSELEAQLTVAKQNKAKASGIARAALNLENAALALNNKELAQNAAELHRNALRQNEAVRGARQSSQVQKGALSTGLTFAGVRGATLAASKSFLAGAASIAIFAKLVKASADLEEQLNVFRATTGATVAEMEAVDAAAVKLGADLTLPSVSASDAAEAMVELAKAGLSVEDSVDAARGVLQLATAAAISNEEATRLAANALNAFSLAGRDAERVADVLANSANLAQGSIADVGIAFQQAASAGRTVGLSFEDTSLFLTELAQNGLRGSDAGTSLRTALIRLIHPSKEAAAAMAKLGIEIRDSNGNLRPDVFLQLADATRNLSPAQRDATIALIGGQDAFRALSILGRQTADEFINLRKALRAEGTAADLAAARSRGLHGAVDALGSSLATVGVTIGTKLGPGIADFTRNVAAGVNALAASDTVADTLNSSLTAISTTFHAIGDAAQLAGPPALGLANQLLRVANSIGVTSILAGVAAYKLLPTVLKAVTASSLAAHASLLLQVRSLGQLRTALAAMTVGINPVLLGIAAIAGGLLFLATRESEAERATRKLTDAVNELVDAQARLRSAQDTSTRAGTDVNRARLALFDARDAVGEARTRVRKSEPGTTARTRAELHLRVALDDVAAAQLRVDQATREAADAALIASNAASREKQAREEEVEALERSTQAIRNKVRVVVRGNPVAEARQEAIAAKLFTLELDEQIKKLRESDDADSLRHANRLARLKLFINLTKQVPDEHTFQILVEAPDLQSLTAQLAQQFGISVRTAAEIIKRGKELQDAFNSLLSGITLEPPARDALNDLGREAAAAIRGGIFSMGGEIADAIGDIVKGARNRIQGLERQGLDLEIEGASPGERLANAQAVLAEEQRILRIQRERAGKNADASVSVRRAQERVRQAQQAVESIQNEIDAAQEEADKKRKDAIEKSDQNALDKLERQRDKRQGRLDDAKATETLADDLRQTILLRNLIHKQINRIRDLIKDREVQRDAIRALQKIERDLNRDITDLQDERKQQIRDRIAESIQLDIEFFSITGNVAGEIRAREREINRLRKLQNATKRGTIEYRRYRNLIAEQQKAIEELTKQQREKNNAFAEMGFAFLTAQQGFAANLLNNLLPLGAIGGTVGNSGGTLTGPSAGSPLSGPRGFGGIDPLTGRPLGESGGPAAGMSEARRMTEANAVGGFTATQAATLIALTKRVVELLSHIDTKGKHPEAKKAQVANATSMDVHK